MNKNIKYLLENQYLSFNPRELDNDAIPKSMVPDEIKETYYTALPKSTLALLELIENRYYSAGLTNGLKVLDLSDIDVSKIENMYLLFEMDIFKPIERNTYNYSSIPLVIDISGWNAENVYTFQRMFANNKRLVKVIMPYVNTSKVKSMKDMFIGCSALKEIDMRGINTSSLECMTSMFQACESLETLDLSEFNTSKVTQTDKMFCQCFKLKNLNLSSFDTKKVNNMHMMFYYCKELEELDITNFNIKKTGNLRNMFMGCSALSKLYIDPNIFIPENCTRFNLEGMFKGCPAEIIPAWYKGQKK